jgi:hypothetical protein
MLGQMGSGRVGGIVSIFDGTNNDHLFIYSDNNGAAWSTTALALGSDPFPHGGLHPWPAIAGGHDTTGFMFPCYIGSAIGFLRTPDNGTAWAVVTISPGGSLPNGYAVEPAMVRTPHGYIIFARTSVTNGVAGNIYATTAPLDMSSWSDWVDTGIPLSNNVPNAIYDSGNVYVYATYRENAGTAVPDVQENTMRVYIQKAKLCFDNGGAMPTAYSVAGRYPKSSTGYIHSMKFPSGDWFHHFKVGEDILSSTVPANGQICAITTASTPALGFGVEEGPVANLLRNWHFSHWPLGDTFTGVTVTGTETAYAWQTANGNAPATMSVTRALIDEEQSRQFSHRPLYGLKIDTTAVPDDFTGIRQIIYGEEARRMIMAMTGRGLVTAVLQGVGSPLPLARVAITLDYGVGGTTDTIVSASFPTVYALNDGAWEAEVELAIANTSAAIVWGSNPQLRTQFDCDSTATGWIATLVGAGLFPGRAPEMRMIGPIEAGQIAATQGRLVLANGANNNVVLPLAGIIRISGPTGAFSITGIEHDPEMQGLVTIHNATSQDMTIAHNSGSSISTNRINCLTGADIVLTGTSSVTLYYSPSDSLWQVVATNG